MYFRILWVRCLSCLRGAPADGSDVYYAEIGSVLTLNDLFRSTWGAAFPLFANALFSHLGIGGGNSLLGGLACLFIPFPFLFIK